MSRIRRILFPIDFSQGCEALMPTARKMLECWDAELTLMHVMDPRQSLGRKYDLQRLVAKVTALAGSEIPTRRIRCRLEQGTPGERILEYARTQNLDLILLSAGGSWNVYGRPVGAVADQILSEASCAVWLDWGSARSRATSGMYARHVACALGLDECDEDILRAAANVTADLAAELTVIHALSPDPGRAARFREAAAARKRITQLQRRISLEAEVAVEAGAARDVISRTIQNRETGLLVTGNWRESILASEAECPVLRLPIPVSVGAYIAPPECAVLGMSA